MGFIANFIRFPAVKNFENWLRFHIVIESFKVGTFLRHSVDAMRAVHIYDYIVELTRRKHCSGVQPMRL